MIQFNLLFFKHYLCLSWWKVWYHKKLKRRAPSENDMLLLLLSCIKKAYFASYLEFQSKTIAYCYYFSSAHTQQ